MINIKKSWYKCTYCNTASVLIFMYPLFSTVVRHWNSTIFGVILLLGLIYFFTNKNKEPEQQLHKYEKIFLWVLACNFLVFVVTSALNPPEELSEIRFDIELRFLLIIPFYYLLIKCHHIYKSLIFGAIISLFIALLFCGYFIVLDGQDEFSGIYSRLYTGPIILIYMTLSLGYLLGEDKIRGNRSRYLIVAIGIISCLMIILTSARVAYLGLIVVGVMLVIFFAKKRQKSIYLLVMFGTFLLVGYTTPQVKNRISQAYDQFSQYAKLSKNERNTTGHLENSSVGIRLEMWRSAPLILRDSPIFGVGNGNYNKVMEKYVLEKELNPVVNEHSHAHNVFVNVLVLKGTIGLIITILVMFFPLYVYIVTYRYARDSAKVGILFVTVMVIISMNETAPFVKSNFVATYLLISIILFQYNMMKYKQSLRVKKT